MIAYGVVALGGFAFGCTALWLALSLKVTEMEVRYDELRKRALVLRKDLLKERLRSRTAEGKLCRLADSITYRAEEEGQ
jgi:hypothetical protein